MVHISRRGAGMKHRYHVFLTHDWGKDEHGRDNHARVSEINDALKERGFVTWFDSDRMTGNVPKQMTTGIDHSVLVVVFVTRRYVNKCNVPDNDNCKFPHPGIVRTSQN